MARSLCSRPVARPLRRVFFASVAMPPSGMGATGRYEAWARRVSSAASPYLSQSLFSSFSSCGLCLLCCAVSSSPPHVPPPSRACSSSAQIDCSRGGRHKCNFITSPLTPGFSSPRSSTHVIHLTGAFQNVNPSQVGFMSQHQQLVSSLGIYMAVSKKQELVPSRRGPQLLDTWSLKPRAVRGVPVF